MGLLTLSRALTPIEDVLASVALAAFKRGLKFDFDEDRKNKNKTEGIDVYVHKRYNDDNENVEYFYLWIEHHARPNIMVLNLKGEPCYRLGVTDQAHYDRIMYDFTLEYLRLMPDHCITLYEKTYFYLKDMEVLEARGGYYEGWCYTQPNV